MKAAPRTLKQVFGGQRALLVLTIVLLATTLLAGTGLLAVSAHFLTATALAGAAATGFNFFGPSAGIRALTFARILSRYGEKLVGHDATLRIARDLRRWFFARALPLAPLDLGRERVGDLLARLIADIDQADGLLVRAIGPLLALLVLVIALLLGIAWLLAAAALWMALVFALLGLVLPALLSLRSDDAERRQTLDRAALRQRLHEALEGAGDLIAMDAVAPRLQEIDADARRLEDSSLQLQRRQSLAQLAHGLIVAAGLAILLWQLLLGFEAGALTAPQAAALLFAGLAGFEAASGLALAWQSLRQARASLRRLREVAGREPVIGDIAQAQALPANGELRLHGVRFGWHGDAGRILLDGVDLSIAPGDRVLIRGDSGAGKSSLLALLLRLRDPDAGHIRFGGIDLRQASQAQWHRRIAWLPQEAPVFAGSVRENLLMGDAQADDARLWQVLAQVRMAQAVRALPDGLDGWIDAAGASLSAGQARRIALARALLRDAPLLLLDEPTEGLDADTAQGLLQDLARVSAGRSLIVISHAPIPAELTPRRYRLRDGRLLAESAQ
ncbi:thiol reductant ABC exporter subunit CydC [Luteimonas sp. e5]